MPVIRRPQKGTFIDPDMELVQVRDVEVHGYQLKQRIGFLAPHVPEKKRRPAAKPAPRRGTRGKK